MRYDDESEAAAASKQVEGIEPRYSGGGGGGCRVPCSAPARCQCVGVYWPPLPPALSVNAKCREIPACLPILETRTDEGHPLPPCFNVPSPLPNERPTRPQPHASSSQQPALISHQLKVTDAVSRRAPAGSSASGSGCKPGRGQERLTVLWLIRGASGTLGAGSSGPQVPQVLLN